MNKSFINWYGGKYYQAKAIISLLTEHRVYVEVFGGAAHVLFRKERSKIEVYNDINEGLYTLFKVLRSKYKNKLIRKLILTPYSRKEYYICRDTWITEKNEVEKARKFFTATLQSVQATHSGWSYSTGVSRRSMSQTVSRWLGKVELLPDAVERLREVQVENLDFRELIPKYDSKDTLFYLDPPYIPTTRVSKKVYKHEMSFEDHEDLVSILKNVKGKCILSGYNNELYEQLKWNKVFLGEYSTRNSVGDSRKEFVWLNF